MPEYYFFCVNYPINTLNQTQYAQFLLHMQNPLIYIFEWLNTELIPLSH